MVFSLKKYKLQAVLLLHGMPMVTVMMKTTMKPASLMAGTAVDPMSIQIGVKFVNALVREDQVEEMGYSNRNPFFDNQK